MKLAIKSVLKVKQKGPTRFEVKVRLADDTAAVVLLSTAAFAELIQHGNQIFQLGGASAT